MRSEDGEVTVEVDAGEPSESPAPKKAKKTSAKKAPAKKAAAKKAPAKAAKKAPAKKAAAKKDGAARRSKLVLTGELEKVEIDKAFVKVIGKVQKIRKLATFAEALTLLLNMSVARFTALLNYENKQKAAQG